MQGTCFWFFFPTSSQLARDSLDMLFVSLTMDLLGITRRRQDDMDIASKTRESLVSGYGSSLVLRVALILRARGKCAQERVTDSSWRSSKHSSLDDECVHFSFAALDQNVAGARTTKSRDGGD
ncbi:uncharacterized protein BKA55DRAFT_678730 [Fusarium redolens]|uniref:Uncharacterized protein n=1 Tax=Fusarium redolens TaxID=48865 RepID=A0A9P9GFB0_FUSRE|nr:uncharacterized protein BKA55DRAFT_678730 [Fusarium redolens]KAH7237482.1 hypothetical protein BKA55DRAFT_678730 [Fusarium redolens]